MGYGAPSLPSQLPPAGWLKAIRYSALNSLLVRSVTQADLWLGGKVSAGASVYWYYRLAPGDYTTGNIAPNEVFDRPLIEGHYARFTVS